MNNLKFYFYPLLSGLLLSLAWPKIGDQFYVIFVSLIPLFYFTVFAKDKKMGVGKFYWLTLPCFLSWNLLTTWWVYFASAEGAALAIILNSLFMNLVFSVFYSFYKKRNSWLAFSALIPIWLAWEKLHLTWELTWPWLTLGNVFADQTYIIQWYEYTGHLGGTAWILVTNILLFKALYHYAQGERGFRLWDFSLLTLFLPIGISLLLEFTYKSPGNDKAHMVVVQPNIDPYNEKFSNLSSADQLQKILRLASTKITDSTKYVIAPETSIPKNLIEEEIQYSDEYAIIDSFLKIHPQIHLLTGISSMVLFPDKESAPVSAREFSPRPNEKIWIDFYNTASQFHLNKPIDFYHKSKLVPGVERMPYSFLFKPLEKLTIDLGGTSGSLGLQEEREIFTSTDAKFKAAPVICYESVYGSYVGDYIKLGANFIAIITNDGWWEDTPGYKQHLAYARLRAIECRKPIVRSANTGISCFIDEMGNISQATEWWKEAVISDTIIVNNEHTLYVKWGDWLVWLSFGYFIYLIIVTKKSLF